MADPGDVARAPADFSPDTGEVLHARLRKGSANTQRGVKRFVEELVARVRRAGAAGEIVARFDSGYRSNATLATLERLDVRYTMVVKANNVAVATVIAAIDDGDLVESTTPLAARPRWPSAATGTGAWSCRTRLLDQRQRRCGRTGVTSPSSPTSTATP